MCGFQIIYRWLRPLLFLIDPERAHALVLKSLKKIYRPALVKWRISHFIKKPTTVFGLTFPNPVGLSAGLEKSGDCLDALFGLGFGFIEVGGVTPKPQPGNPKPRLFRLPQARALINRMGFANLGVDYLVQRLKQRKIAGIVGVNIAKNLTTSLEDAYQDYEICLEKVFPYADFVTINISSPNTPRLRELQSGIYLHELLNKLKVKQLALTTQYQRQVPLLLKIAPDLTAEEIAEIAQTALTQGIDGIVAVNTTRARQAVAGLPHADEEGGLSGAPLFAMTLRVVKQLHQILGNQMPIVAVGGIMSAEDAKQLFQAGASLVQIYTGLIYQGPALIENIVKSIK
jgi:dihydroorotate dehydrogenase